MKGFFFAFALVFIVVIANGQTEYFTGNISLEEIRLNWSDENAETGIPLSISLNKILDCNYNRVDIELVESEYKELNLDNLDLTQYWAPVADISFKPELAVDQRKSRLYITFSPFRLNHSSGNIEYLTRFTFRVTGEISKLKSGISRTYNSESLLKSGNWFKIKVDTTGVYKLTFDELKAIGLSNPANARVFSYGGRQLSYWNKDASYDDLNEIPVKVEKGSDGEFNSGDYILFYAQGPTGLVYDEDYKFYLHTTHCYSDYIYLFLTSDLGEGLRISEKDENSKTPDITSNSYDSYRYHEVDQVNLVRSGRRWYGERIHPGEEDSIAFYFPNLVSNEKITGLVAVAGRKPANTAYPDFIFSSGGKQLVNLTITASLSDYRFGEYKESAISFLPASGKVFIKYAFECKNNTPEGLLDKICLNAREILVFKPGKQLYFRDSRLITSKVARFEIENSNTTFEVWDVTNPTKPNAVKTKINGQITSFIFTTDSARREFIAFNRDQLLTPVYKGNDLGRVENQDLHGSPTADLTIVCPSKFRKYADELADIHRNHDSMTVLIASPEEIYNEFSGGTPDVTAIRNYMRFLYNRGDGNYPKYLLLFGDGTYDNKDIKKSGSNIILTYQSATAEVESTSYVTDDFFGLLDDNEGENEGVLDIGIGRFPVQTDEEAAVMIDKIKHYMSGETLGDWRNQITIIADDEDQGVHLTDADAVCKMVNANYPQFNINKIYFDAYKQVSVSAGQRYPDVTTAVYQQVERGSTVIDYVGHGNPRILSHEEILSVQDVRTWNNYDKLAVFVTASCEVGRFDDHDRTSFGEWIVLNPYGAGIVAFTTTRVVYISNNATLNLNFFEQVFRPELHMGDIIRIAKNNTNSPTETNKRNFTLLGDPALKLVMPDNKIIISKINGEPLYTTEQNESDLFSNLKGDEHLVSILGDTIRALDTVMIEGYVVDQLGNPIFKNGILYPTIYDKPVSITTNANDKTSPKLSFDLQNSVLYKGKASIVDGFFNFKFIVPKDINYTYGHGKISLYATIDSVDANGSCRDFVIGGTSDIEFVDNQGPQIDLFMNDTTFKNGDMTNEKPILLAKLWDESGINTTGNGIGHNITAIIDGNSEKVYSLNNYYEGNTDMFNAGEIKFPLRDLAPGPHIVKFKAWDIYNNSSDAEIGFYVYDGNSVVIDKLLNYPNPFWDQTEFIFEHNQASSKNNIRIEIFDLMGKKMTELNAVDNSGSFKIAPIVWDGTGSDGAKLARGMYIYKVQLTNSLGAKTSKSSKLMIIK